MNWSRKGTVYMETGKKMTEIRPDDIMNGSNPERAYPAYGGLFPGTDIWKTFWVRGFYGISCFCGNRILRNRYFPVPETGCILETYKKWKSYRADGPSDFYILNTKFGGAMFVLLGIVMMILPWILE